MISTFKCSIQIISILMFQFYDPKHRWQYFFIVLHSLLFLRLLVQPSYWWTVLTFSSSALLDIINFSRLSLSFWAMCFKNYSIRCKQMLKTRIKMLSSLIIKELILCAVHKMAFEWPICSRQIIRTFKFNEIWVVTRRGEYRIRIYVCLGKNDYNYNFYLNNFKQLASNKGVIFYASITFCCKILN